MSDEPAKKKACKNFVRDESAEAIVRYIGLDGKKRSIKITNFSIFEIQKYGNFRIDYSRHNYSYFKELHIHLQGSYLPAEIIVQQHAMGESYGHCFTSFGLRKAAKNLILDLEEEIMNKNADAVKDKNDKAEKSEDAEPKDDKAVISNGENIAASKNDAVISKDDDTAESKNDAKPKDVVEDTHSLSPAEQANSLLKSILSNNLKANDSDVCDDDDDENESMAACSDNSDLQPGECEGLIAFITDKQYIIRQCVISADEITIGIIPNTRAFKDTGVTIMYTDSEIVQI